MGKVGEEERSNSSGVEEWAFVSFRVAPRPAYQLRPILTFFGVGWNRGKALCPLFLLSNCFIIDIYHLWNALWKIYTSIFRPIALVSIVFM
jgi:hypothetical protein